MNRNQLFDGLCAYIHELAEMNYADELPTQVYVDKCRRFGIKAGNSPFNDMEFVAAFRDFLIEFSNTLDRSEGALK